MSLNEFIGKDNIFNLDRIRRFCRRSTASGSVLLISGPRGTGKTRLADEALSEPNGCWQNFFPSLFGDVGMRKRIAIKRKPRNLDRYLLKVDVDPNFPNPKKTDKDTSLPDENTLAYGLVNNIIFALTSNLDVNASPRWHGKTLRSRLGWRGYWLSPNALLLPSGWLQPTLSIGFLLFFLIFIQFSSIWQLLFHRLPLISNCSLGLLALQLVFCFLIFSASWLLCRWWDWRALRKMTHRLYAMVNTSTNKETHNQESAAESQWTSKLPWIVVIVILGLWFFDANTSGLRPTLQRWLANTEDNSIVYMFAMLLLSGSIIAYSVAHKDKLSLGTSEEYSQSNQAWMIDQLRRYLFQCHRCGLEPVLVLDELDKLDDMGRLVLQSRRDGAASSEVASDVKSNDDQIKDKLDLFLIAFARLKLSLGAEFIWILIGGPNIYARLHNDRHNRTDGTLGILATVIHQEIILGPMAFGDAKKLQSNDCSENDIQMIWLRARGNVSSMKRMLDTKDIPKGSPRAKTLGNALIAIWSPDEISDQMDLYGPRHYKDRLQMAWGAMWLRIGMMDLANRFLNELVTYDDVKNALGKEYYRLFANERQASEDDLNLQVQALLSGHPNLLRLLGETILFMYLVRNEYIENGNGKQPVRFCIEYEDEE